MYMYDVQFILLCVGTPPQCLGDSFLWTCRKSAVLRVIIFTILSMGIPSAALTLWTWIGYLRQQIRVKKIHTRGNVS